MRDGESILELEKIIFKMFKDSSELSFEAIVNNLNQNPVWRNADPWTIRKALESLISDDKLEVLTYALKEKD